MVERSSVRAALLAIVVVAVAGCATSTALKNGRSAEDRQDYDRAVLEYQRALQLNPNSADAKTSLQRARLRASQDHFSRARRLAAIGKLDDALAEYQLAAEMNPSSGQIAEELRTTQNLLRTKVTTSRDGKTQLETLVDRMRDQPAPGLAAPTDLLTDSWTFRNASNQDILRAIAQVSNVNVVFDPAFMPTSISIDLRNQTFDQALRSITSSTKTFFRVTAPRTITIVPDTPAKRREYEEEIVRTFFLSNADLKETMDLLRIVIDARAIGSTAGTNALTIHDTADRIAAAARLIDVIDKARPEVLIDVELLEVNRQKLMEYGLQFASPGVAGVAGLADVNRSNLSLADLRNLGQDQILMTGVPGLYYRLLKTEASSRVLANPQLRTVVGMPASAAFGDEVPVPAHGRGWRLLGGRRRVLQPRADAPVGRRAHGRRRLDRDRPRHLRPLAPVAGASRRDPLRRHRGADPARRRGRHPGAAILHADDALHCHAARHDLGRAPRQHAPRRARRARPAACARGAAVKVMALNKGTSARP
jgi:general secretion pathway protein D